VHAVARGIRRRIGAAPTQKAPATPRAISAMLERVPDTLVGKRDRAILLIGFAAALRRSELAALHVSDLDRWSAVAHHAAPSAEPVPDGARRGAWDRRGAGGGRQPLHRPLRRRCLQPRRAGPP